MLLAGVVVPGLAAVNTSAATTTVADPGSVQFWGQPSGYVNTNGQLVPTPVTLAGLTNVVSVSVGENFVVALLGDGTVWGEGDNFYGELGNSAAGGYSSTPVQVKSSSGNPLSGIVSVAAGPTHAVAVGSDGTVYNWGNETDASGQTVPTDTTAVTVAVPPAPTGTAAVARPMVAAGQGWSMLLRGDGTVWAWGANDSGQTGQPPDPNCTVVSCPSTPPGEIPDPTGAGALSGVTSIAAGMKFGAAVVQGTPYLWGESFYGAISNVPAALPAPTTGDTPSVTKVSSSWSGLSVLGLTTAGTVLGWGDDYQGQLGDGVTPGTVSDAPGAVVVQDPNDPSKAFSGVADIASGSWDSMAILADGSVWTWGDNTRAQLGTGVTATSGGSSVPVRSLATSASALATASDQMFTVAGAPPVAATTVPATVGGNGVDTGVDVTAGEGVTTIATGIATYGSDSGACSGLVGTDPDGNRYVNGTACGTPKYDATAPDPTAPVGALIGRIGTSGNWSMLGSNAATPPPGTGRLYLLYNDPAPGNNSGSYQATISVPSSVAGTTGAPGTPTGVWVSPGELFSVHATGAVGYGYEGGSGCVGYPYSDPDGNRTVYSDAAGTTGGTACSPSTKAASTTAPLPGYPVGMLIARVGSTGPWMPAGSSTTLTSPAVGQVFLAVNDDAPDNNAGGFNAVVNPGSQAAAAVTQQTPTAPENLHVQGAAADHVTVGWTDTSAAESKEVVAYGRAYSGVYTFVDQPAGTTSFTQTGLSAGQQWTYFVRSCTNTQCSAWSNAVTGTAQPPTADLHLKLSGPLALGTTQSATYTLSVTNNGPDTATAVSVVDTLPDGLSPTSSSPGCVNSFAPVHVTCTLGDMPAASTQTVTFTALSSTTSPMVDQATVTTTSSDPNPSDNTASLSINIPGKPGAPQLTAASVSTNTANLFWTAPSGNATTFTLAYAPYGQPYVFVPVGQTTAYTVTGLSSRASYNFFVQGCLAGVCSDWSNGVQAFTGTVQLAGLEVNQSTQDWKDSVALIANKETVVRAFFQLQQPGTSVPISATLHAYRNGAELADSPIRPFNAGGAVTVASTLGSRADLSSSLNWYLPGDWENGTVTLKVDVDGGGVDCQEAAGPTPHDCSVDATFNTSSTPDIKFFRVPWYDTADTSGTKHLATTAEVSALADQIRREYPTSQITYSDSVFGTTYVSGAPFRSQLHDALIAQRAADGCKANCNTVYFAVVETTGIPKGETAPASEESGTVAYYTQGGYRSAAAHEMSHAFGRPHSVSQDAPGANAATGIYSGWCNEQPVKTTEQFPYIQSGVSTTQYPNGKRYTMGPMDQGQDSLVYGIDTGQLFTSTPAVPPVVDPNVVNELMSYCAAPVTTEGQWASSYTYKKLIDSGFKVTDGYTGKGPAAAPSPYFVVSGEVAPNGTVTFSPLWHETTTDPGADAPDTGAYSVDLLDATGNVLATQAFGATGGDSAPSVNGGPQIDPNLQFRVAVADPGAVSSLVVRQGQTILATHAAPPAPPTLTITSPAAGDNVLGGTLHVAWTAAGSDATPLTYAVRYSPDGGATWVGLGQNLTATTLDVPASNLRGSAAGTIEVNASDGFHTTTVTVTPLAVADNPPELQLAAPGDGTAYTGDQEIVFSASALDREDGNLPGTSIAWQSSLDGPLGTGLSLVKDASQLTPGTHVITAVATDSAGNRAMASVTITVARNAATPATTSTTQGGAPAGGGGTNAGTSGPGQLVATVSSPQAGTFSFDVPPAPPALPTDLSRLPVAMDIHAPPASTSAPLTITFVIDPAALPQGLAPNQIVVVRDGTALPGCAANPLPPCVQQATANSQGGVVITVLADHASLWQFGYAKDERIAGVDRVATAVATSQATFAPGDAGTVVLATDDNYADALVGVPLAARGHGPVLLTDPTGLDPRVAAEIARVLPVGRTVHLLGGAAAISDTVAAQLSSAGFVVDRLAGPDRWATALAVANALGPIQSVFVASGSDFADALSAGPAAAVSAGAIVLSDGGHLGDSTAAFIGAHPHLPLYAVGGPAAAAVPGAQSLVGVDRYATSALVAATFFHQPGVVGVASGTNYPDALAAGSRLAILGVPVLLTDPVALPGSISSFLTQIAGTLGRVEVYGGTSAVSPGVDSQLVSLFG